MADSELLSFARNELFNLPVESQALLFTELRKRQLSIDTATSPDAPLTVYEELHEGYSSEIIYEILEEIENGKTRQLIEAALITNGTEETIVHKLINTARQIAAQKLKIADFDFLLGVLFCSSGVAITFLPLTMHANRAAYIIAWTSIIFGALKFVQGIFNKSRYKKIIKELS